MSPNNNRRRVNLDSMISSELSWNPRANFTSSSKHSENGARPTCMGIWKYVQQSKVIVFCFKCLVVIGVFAAGFCLGSLFEATYHQNCSDSNGTLTPKQLFGSTAVGYSGSVNSQGLKSGFGEAFHPNGNIAYRGLWNDDTRTGLGTSFLPDGHMEASGHWANDVLDGWASRAYNATHSYIGFFKKGQRSGQGLEYTNDTLVYEGHFEEDARWGFGIEFLDDQVIYEGQWSKGQRHGLGTEYQPSHPGYYYRGEWEWGQKSGHGRNVFGSEANYYEGSYVNGLREGKGRIVLPMRNYSYEGDWVADKMEGFGKLEYTDGKQYEGHFKDGLFHGQGTYRDSEGNVFIGMYEKSHKDGLGTMKYSKGYNVEGSWHHGMLQGYGKIIFPLNGTICDVKYGQDGHEVRRGPCVKN